jgi:hypothetical protein
MFHTFPSQRQMNTNAISEVITHEAKTVPHGDYRDDTMTTTAAQGGEPPH